MNLSIIIILLYSRGIEIAEEFDGRFTFLGENTEKYINFSVSIEEKVAIKKVK